MIYDSARTSRLSLEVRLAALQRTRNQSDAKVQELEKAHSEHTRMGLDLRRQLFSKFSEVSDHMDVVETQFSIVDGQLESSRSSSSGWKLGTATTSTTTSLSWLAPLS